MKTLIKLSFFLCLVFLFSACSTTYKPYSSFTNDGYRETFFAPDIVSVSFLGNSNTSYEDVNDFVMLRSAELALENGYPYFEIIEKKDLTKQSVQTISGGSSKAVETTTQKGNSKVKTTEVTHSGPSTVLHQYPSILLEIKLHQEKPVGVTVYESAFINRTIKAKHDIKK